MKVKNNGLLIIILGALTALAPFSIDMYLPSFPTVAKELNTPVSTIQLSLASFFVGMALGQLFIGPISDRFGRKTPLYTSHGYKLRFFKEFWSGQPRL
jgi:DHA1 family bicyclomycin/chloramphenicol resistance-like MFS transporter